MNGELINRDFKINMSLDEIIRLNKSVIDQSLGRKCNTSSRNKWLNGKKNDSSDTDHSVPLPSSLGSGFIYVSKTSPLLKEQKRRIMEAATNRQVNSNLLRRTKKIIPAYYHIIRTDTGFERVLLPVRMPFNKKSKKRGGRRRIKNNTKMETGTSTNQTCQVRGISIHNNFRRNLKKDDDCQKNNASLDNADDEVVILYSSIKSDVKNDVKKEAMDVDTPTNSSLLSNIQGCNFIPQKPLDKTLNDRFTGLKTSSFSNFSF